MNINEIKDQVKAMYNNNAVEGIVELLTEQFGYNNVNNYFNENDAVSKNDALYMYKHDLIKEIKDSDNDDLDSTLNFNYIDEIFEAMKSINDSFGFYFTNVDTYQPCDILMDNYLDAVDDLYNETW